MQHMTRLAPAAMPDADACWAAFLRRDRAMDGQFVGCVATTGVPYLLQLDDGRIMKLKVEAYYTSGQDSCNAHGSMGSGSGNFTWRWRFL